MLCWTVVLLSSQHVRAQATVSVQNTMLGKLLLASREPGTSEKAARDEIDVVIASIQLKRRALLRVRRNVVPICALRMELAALLADVMHPCSPIDMASDAQPLLNYGPTSDPSQFPKDCSRVKSRCSTEATRGFCWKPAVVAHTEDI
jgi:hypothetical protein